MRVALGVTGCIAAYKAIEVLRSLTKSGAAVSVVLTRAAERFVTPLTFESLSGREVIRGLFRPGRNVEIEHIRVAQEIDLLAVVPATANILGKFAHGVADDFLSTLYLATPAPVLLAPAMNVEMWNHPAVQTNVETLRGRGHVFCNPDAGALACGMEGEGRLAEVETIVEAALAILARSNDLAGLKVLVSAGPTIEDLDPVRFLSNRSSGKMGYAVAEAARVRGAEVFLVTGPTELSAPHGVTVARVRSAGEMKDAMLRFFPGADVVVMASAVSDFRPATYSRAKIKKGSAPPVLELAPNDDILEALGRLRRDQLLIGFAAETGDLLPHAREKLEHKGADLIVANDVSAGVFGSDSASVFLVPRAGEVVALEHQTKRAIAHRILDAALQLRARAGAAMLKTSPES